VEEKVSTISSLELLSTPNQSIPPDPDSTLHIKVQALVRLILPNKDRSTTSASMALDSKFLTLGLSEATPLNHDSEEFKGLHRYFHQSHPGRTESNDMPAADHTDIVVEDIFRISRTKELAGFGDVDLRNAKDSRRLLWHGSRTSNIAGILSQGLRIAPPGVPDHGTRWGHGIYLTDESRKAWTYCHPDESDGVAFLLLYEALIGDPVHEVEEEDRTTCQKLSQKGLLAAFYKCWTGWEWVDAGNVYETLAGVLMPPPSAERGSPGLIRRPRYHNEVRVYTTIPMSGGPLLMMTVHRLQHTASPAPVSCQGVNQ
jgi:poly [ADP-ribose] polymerase